MKLKVSPGCPPEGSYTGVLSAIEDYHSLEYGDGLRWVFTVIAGPQARKNASRVTGFRVTPNNTLGKLLAAMLGRPLDPDEEIDPDDLVGRQFTIVVKATEGGATRVETAVPPAVE
jgi:hypothetical protein